MTITLTFHGAAGCVTGSSYLLTTPHAKILIDCGLFQGSKTLKALNYNPFPFKAADIDAVLLTHAHIDHSGQLPKLVRAGFRGPIHATDGTRALCEIMLADCGHIQEMEVEHLNRRNQERGKPLVEPIYTAQDAAKTMRFFSPVEYEVWTRVVKGVRARWWDAGHILGSASIEVEVEQEAKPPLRLLFSGDVGSGGRDFLGDPQGPTDGLDYLLTESTYGGTERPVITPPQRRKALADELNRAHAAGGPLLMPAFAIERTQELLADLLDILDAGDAPACQIFLDSPLAIKACEIFLKHGADGEAGQLIDRGDTALGGRIPVNVSGGLLAKGHPIGATGVANIVELVEHLRGEAGARQVAGARIGLAHVLGFAAVSASAVHILEKA